MISPESYEYASLINVFAFKLYNNVRRSDYNLVTSPAQLMISLGLLAIASDNITQSQFQSFLGYGDPSKLGACLKQGIHEVLHWIEKTSITSIKIEKTIPIMQTYPMLLKSMGIDYNQFFESIDFVKGSVGFGKQLNQLVQDTCNLGSFIQPGSLNSFVRILIVNSLRYECSFLMPFAAHLTTQDSFLVNNYHTNYRQILVETFMMNQIMFAKFFDDKIATFVSLPLRDSRLHLDLILPKIHIQEYESIFNYQAYVQYQIQSPKIKIHVKLPRFRVKQEPSLALKDILKNMGIQDLFQQMKADLSKIDKSKSAFVSEILTSPSIEVHEEDETLVQTLEIPKYTQPPQVVSFNRPFIYIVREAHTNSILLFGKLIDPRDM